MKDITSTSFGLLIAFFLPGLAGFFSLAFWSPAVKGVFDTFLTAESNVGLFFLVLAGAVIIGLQVTLVRWLLFERLICRSVRLDQSDFEQLGGNEAALEAFRAVVDEHYRYHQFWGGMVVVMPALFLGWLAQSWVTLHPYSKIALIVGFALVEAVTAWGAASAWRNYVTRGKPILKGAQYAQRVAQDSEKEGGKGREESQEGEEESQKEG